MEAYIYLILAIMGEVMGTSALKASYGMTKLWPATVVVLGYSITFWALSITLKVLPVGVVYAIWSGLGIVSMVFIGTFIFQESFTPIHFLGITCIILGVLILTLLATPLNS